MGTRRSGLLLLVPALCARSLPLAGQSFREQVQVELVRIEILASDAGGRPITDLRAEEMRVRVDGRPVAFESFERSGVSVPSSAGPQPLLPPIPTGKPAPPEPREPAAPRALPSFSIAILVDETSSEPSNRQAACREILDFLGKGLPPDVRMLVLRFDGSLRVETGWTSDPEAIRRAIAAVGASRMVPRVGVPGQLSGNPEHGAPNVALEAMEAAGHARTSLAAVFDSLRIFPESPGRKALFVLTDGAPFLTPSEIARDLIQSSSTSVDSSMPDAARRAALEADRDTDLLLDGLSWDRTHSAPLQAEIARLALLRGIEIHPVRSAAQDFSGRVRTDRAFHERATVQGGLPLSNRSNRAANTVPLTDLTAGQGMEAIAETTGGEAILSRRMLDDGLRRELSLREGTYAVTFRDPFSGDHRFHRVEIESRRGARLRYRRGYRVLDTREALLEGVVNRLYLAADANPLAVRLQIEPRAGKPGGPVPVDVAVGYPAPPAAGGAAGDASAVRVIGVCAVRNGRLRRPVDWNGEAERTSFGSAAWLVRTGTVELPPGAYRWSFAIRDEQTGITSYLAFDRAVP